MARSAFPAALLAVCLAVLGGCSGFPPVEIRLGTGVPANPRYVGLIAADEPAAVRAAQEVLAAGGTAADAATTLGFALGVTLPSTAGLGGGGVCLVHDHQSRKVEVLRFFSETTPSAPLLAAGLRLLHATYGTKPWAQVVAPAERLARFGHSVSQSLVDDLGDGSLLVNDGPAFTAFLNARRELLRASETQMHPDLATVLAGIRAGEDSAAPLTWSVAEAVGEGVFSVAGIETANGFVTADKNGSAVACALSVGKLFGAGAMAPGQGYLVAAPAQPVAGPTLVMGLDPNTRRLRFALAAAGASAVEETAAALRMLATAPPSVSRVGAMLSERGGKGRMNMLGCAVDGLDRTRCEAAADPRGAGHAVVMGERR